MELLAQDMLAPTLNLLNNAEITGNLLTHDNPVVR